MSLAMAIVYMSYVIRHYVHHLHHMIMSLATMIIFSNRRMADVPTLTQVCNKSLKCFCALCIMMSQVAIFATEGQTMSIHYNSLSSVKT